MQGGAARACVLCGAVVAGKSVHCGDILTMAAKGGCYNEIMNKALVNICESSVAWHNMEGRSDYMVYNCVGCNHWLQRRVRKDRFLAPLASLHRFMRTLDMTFIPDARITKRLCQSLCATHMPPGGAVLENYYMKLFTEFEINTIRQINDSNSLDVRHLFAKHFARSNAHSFLFTCKNQVEFMREHRDPPSRRHSDTIDSFSYDTIKNAIQDRARLNTEHSAVFF